MKILPIFTAFSETYNMFETKKNIYPYVLVFPQISLNTQNMLYEVALNKNICVFCGETK